MTESFSKQKESYFLAISHFLFSYLIQIETYILYRHQTVDLKTFAGFLLRQPLIQFEHVLFAILSFFLFTLLLSYRNLITSLLTIFIWFFSCLYLVIDQMAFPFFGNHLQVSFLEGRIHALGMISDSFFAEMNWVFYFNIFILFATTAFVARRVLTTHSQTPPAIHPKRNIAAIIIILYLPFSWMVTTHSQNHNIDHHPIIALVNGIFQSTSSYPKPTRTLENYDQPVMGTIFQDQSETAPFIEHKTKPNIVLIVLESVGSKQIFPVEPGVFDSTNTPNLYAWSNNMITFPSVYTIFPATIRSHLAMNTGGYAITWGSVFEELNHAYTGITINSLLQNNGYQTGLFSASFLSTENMTTFFNNLKYDFFFDPEKVSKSIKDKKGLNSWGLDEKYVLNEAINWIDQQEGKPFFLHFFTIGTHHPYTIPKGFKGLFDSPKNRKEDYLNALFYGDYIIGHLIDALKQRDLLQNTIILVTGDHGESFEEWHSENLLHKNKLYDENIKSFLAILDTATIKNGSVSNRIGQNGDLLPTIAHLIGVSTEDIPGQNLFDVSYKPRMVFFHKNILPEQWGLRDGQWKFIENKLSPNAPELYHLINDPNEQVNVINQFPEVAEKYRDAIKNWYISTNDQFTARLNGYETLAKSGFNPGNITTAGPKVIAIGVKDAEDNFIKKSQLNPSDLLQVRIKLVADDKDVDYLIEYIDPQNHIVRKTHTIIMDWTTYTAHDALNLPMAIGTWTVNFKNAKGDKTYLSTQFEVSE